MTTPLTLEQAECFLLLEIVKVDGIIRMEELDAAARICRVIGEDFDVDPRRIWSDVLSEDQHTETDAIARLFMEPPTRRATLINRLWEIALSDDDIHPLEVERIAHYSRALDLPPRGLN